MTTLARTLLDLASVLPSDELEAVLARALRGGRITAEELARILGRHPGYPGVRPLRALLQLAGGPAFTRSEAEVQLLALVREAGLPPPACNVEVEGYEVDLYWPPARLAVEVDGYRYHGSHASFERDRRKDAALVAAGITVLRLSWRQVTEGRVATAVKLGQALDRAGGRTWPRGP